MCHVPFFVVHKKTKNAFVVYSHSSLQTFTTSQSFLSFSFDADSTVLIEANLQSCCILKAMAVPPKMSGAAGRKLTGSDGAFIICLNVSSPPKKNMSG